MKKDKKSKRKIDPILQLAEKNRKEKAHLTFKNQDEEDELNKVSKRRMEEERIEEQKRKERDDTFRDMQKIYR